MNRMITPEDLAKFSAHFDENPINAVAMDAVVKNGVNASAVNYEAARKYPHAFSIEIDAGKVCNQKQSGR